MAVHKLYNAYFTYNSVNLSAWVKSITLNDGFPELDSTAMSNASRRHIAGLEEWSIDVDFEQDYASAAVDQTLSPLKGTSSAFEIRADAGTVTTTNPKWTGTALLSQYQPVGGTVGELHMTKAHFASASDLTRATS